METTSQLFTSAATPAAASAFDWAAIWSLVAVALGFDVATVEFALLAAVRAAVSGVTLWPLLPVLHWVLRKCFFRAFKV